MRPKCLRILCAFLAQLAVASMQNKENRASQSVKAISIPFWYDNPMDRFSEPYYDIDGFPESSTSTEKAVTEIVPHFAEGSDTVNITVQLGSSVYLHCKVNDLKEKTISWVRKRGDELHLLSFGRHTYSADSRYSLVYEHPNDWRLLIQYVGERDEGYYECQVSSHPPIVRGVNLNIIVPRMEIVDERGESITDKFCKEGSIIELRCVISRVPKPLKLITWNHAGRMLNFDTIRGGISVKTDATSSGAISRLYIANANSKDSGNYTCSLPEISAVTVSLHVLKGENPLAMQRGNTAAQNVVGVLQLATLLAVS